LERSTSINDLQLLAALQHAGVPTRLLDVTANPLTALWFASASHPNADGLLLAFNLSQYVGSSDLVGVVGPIRVTACRAG
jgi:hypothetical protein